MSSALDFLDNNEPNFIILDMSLPTYEISDTESGGRPQGFGGLEILRYLKMSGLNCPTLVLTGYEAFMREEGIVELSQISEELNNEFGVFLKDVLYYNSAYSEWKNKISLILKNVGIY
ncbi:response regulator [Photobacterium phosphoreum]|uniref:response regulator n=1 Tax=Photobacterium phosphoreum TaxID=659 RepID=UPI0015E6411B|nr:response regulator [Photobacterium phosphoreum]